MYFIRKINKRDEKMIRKKKEKSQIKYVLNRLLDENRENGLTW